MLTNGDPALLTAALGQGFDAIVVGAGVVGLNAALTLQSSGRRVAVVTADTVAETTSNVAAAVWFPTAVGPRDRVLGWGQSTLETLAAMSRDHPGAGVVFRETVMVYRDPPGRPWWTRAVGEVRDAYAHELPATYSHGLHFTVPLVEMPVHLRWLADRFVASGGRLHHRRLTSLHELAGIAPEVINCSGLGARDLVNDLDLFPIRGQIVRTTNPGISRSLRDEHHPEGYTYVHPRTSDVILGGTVEPGRDELTADAEITAAILRRCMTLAPELVDAEVIAPAVGLRPGRASVRLERDDDAVPGSTVVHDYGHGGAGVTLGWGCAYEVARLLDEAGGRMGSRQTSDSSDIGRP